MARQIFFRGEAGPARINVPQAPNIAGAGSVLNGRSPMGDLLRVADEGGRKIAGAVVAIVGRRMDGHVEDAYLEARRRFAEWQAGYNRTHQASQGLDAQADYSLQWNKIAKDIREEYGGYLEGSWHRKLDRKLELGRLYATVDGARWQDQQYGAWGANQEKVQLSNFDRLVQGSPDDLARIQMEKAELVRAWRERNPGMDSTVFERGLDEGIAAGRVQALLARGDIDGAQAALTRYGSAGGDWNRGVAAEAQRRRGTPHGGVGSSNDCSAYTGAIWRPYISDPKIRQAIFGPDGGRSTSENIVQETARRTQGGRTLGNGELAPGRVGPGMVIGLDTGQHAHDRGRRLGIDHIVSTYMGADGRLMVTESSSDKRPGGGVHDTPYEEWYARNKGHKLYGASLVPLLQGGSAGGGAPAGWQEYSGPRGSSIAEKNHNPGNIRHNGRDYDHYASDAEGWLDMASVLRKPGYADLTVQQIAERYVNGKVGQSVVPEYLKAIQAQGFSLGEKPNLQDSQVLARLMKGMAMGESPLGQKYSVAQIHGLISGGAQSHAQAAPVKMSPDVKETYDAFMEQVNKGLMPRERLEGLAGEWAQDKSPKVARRGREILAALRQSQPQAGAQAGAPASQSPQHPAFGGGVLAHDKADLLQRRIDSARELQAKEQARAMAQDILAQTAGFTPAEQKAKAYEVMAGQPAEVQAMVKPLVDAGVKFREDALDAQYGAAMAQFLELAPKLSPLDRDKTVDGLVASGKLSRQKADELRRMNKADLERATSDKEKAFEELLEAGNSRIALGAPDAMTDTSDIDREFARGRLTPQMRKDLIEMRRNGGSLKNFGKDHLDDLYCDMQGKKRGTAKMPAEMYARFFKWGAASGKPLDDDAIKRRLADENLQVAVPGYVWGTRQTTLAKALNKGLQIQGADVPPEREELLTQEMQRLHFTPEQIKDPEIRRQAYANIIYGRK